MGSKLGHTVAHDDVQIYIYHTADLYFMLVEALNNLGRYEIADVLMNQGFYLTYVHWRKLRMRIKRCGKTQVSLTIGGKSNRRGKLPYL